MNFMRKVLDILECFEDFIFDSGCWGEVGVAKPVMADHAVFVGVCDGSLFEGVHVLESFLNFGFHGGEEVVGEGHAADV